MGRTLVTGLNIEDNSVEGVDVNEESLDISLMPFADSSYIATNTKAAIIESSSPDKIKFYGILDRDIVVPENKVMLMINPNTNNFTLKVYGELRII